MGGTISAVCAPSREMLMSGQTLFHVDRSIVRPGQAVPAERRPFHLFPEVLRGRSYETFHVPHPCVTFPVAFAP